MIRTCKNSSFYTIHTLVTCHEIANQYQPILNVIHPYPSLSTPFRCLVVDVVLVIDLVIVVSLGRFLDLREAQDQCWTSSLSDKNQIEFQPLAASQEIGIWYVVINADIPSPSHIHSYTIHSFSSKWPLETVWYYRFVFHAMQHMQCGVQIMASAYLSCHSTQELVLGCSTYLNRTL